MPWHLLIRASDHAYLDLSPGLDFETRLPADRTQVRPPVTGPEADTELPKAG